jgi:large subunit ribosomal protein L1
MLVHPWEVVNGRLHHRSTRLRKNQKNLNTLHSKRYELVAPKVDKELFLEVPQALALVKETANAKFVESVDIAIKLGIDPKKSDQNVRGITTLPHGTGKSRRVAVLAKGDLAAQAEAAGADTVGAEELIAQIQAGFREFDILLATEDMAPQIGKIGRILGARTPNKRNGTVTNAIGAAVKEIKLATRIEYRADKEGVVHLSLGKVNFTDEQLQENFKAALSALVRAKPATSRGKYLRTITLSASMGPGIPVDTTLAGKFASVI